MSAWREVWVVGLVNLTQVGRFFFAPLIHDCGGAQVSVINLLMTLKAIRYQLCNRSSSFTQQEKPRVTMFHFLSDMECKVFYTGVIWARTFLLLSLANTMCIVLADVLQCQCLQKTRSWREDSLDFSTTATFVWSP